MTHRDDQLTISFSKTDMRNEVLSAIAGALAGKGYGWKNQVPLFFSVIDRIDGSDAALEKPVDAVLDAISKTDPDAAYRVAREILAKVSASGIIAQTINRKFSTSAIFAAAAKKATEEWQKDRIADLDRSTLFGLRRVLDEALKLQETIEPQSENGIGLAQKITAWTSEVDARDGQEAARQLEEEITALGQAYQPAFKRLAEAAVVSRPDRSLAQKASALYKALLQSAIIDPDVTGESLKEVVTMAAQATRHYQRDSFGDTKELGSIFRTLAEEKARQAFEAGRHEDVIAIGYAAEDSFSTTNEIERLALISLDERLGAIELTDGLEKRARAALDFCIARDGLSDREGSRLSYEALTQALDLVDQLLKGNEVSVAEEIVTGKKAFHILRGENKDFAGRIVSTTLDVAAHLAAKGERIRAAEICFNSLRSCNYHGNDRKPWVQLTEKYFEYADIPARSFDSIVSLFEKNSGMTDIRISDDTVSLNVSSDTIEHVTRGSFMGQHPSAPQLDPASFVAQLKKGPQ